MRNTLGTLAALCLLAAPALAQENLTCGDYAAMDNAEQMEAIAELESITAQMEGGEGLTATAIHEKLAADCTDQTKVDLLVVDIVKGYKR
jgi:hypothetical protein